ncbi:MAG TPA: helical backbone metal receptor [Thermoanaerobaculia bacterium]|nr:helical backbone metal receptor [Thermoanaerobaculia bacterium]
MRSRLLAAALLGFLGLAPALLLGCRGEAPSSGDAPEKAAAAAPRRIIALTPSVTETLFALGLGDRVVGVGDYDHWPPEVNQKPRLGGLFNPNLEKIVALKPDLAVLIPSEKDLGEKLARFGVDTLTVQNESVADVEKTSVLIAERCGVPAAGRRLAAEMTAALAPRSLPGGAHPKVMISVGRPAGRLADVTVAGPGTFFDELVTRLGGVNAFADSPTKYPQVPLEEIVARSPEIILELRADPLPADRIEELRRDWTALPQVGAVRTGRVEVLASDYAVIPGPRMPLLYKDLEAALSRPPRPILGVGK